MIRRLPPRTISVACLTFLLLPVISGAPRASSDPTPGQLEERRRHLQRQVELLREAREKHQAGTFTRVAEEDGRRLEEEAMQTLREFDPVEATIDLARAGAAGLPGWVKERFHGSVPHHEEALRAADAAKFVNEVAELAHEWKRRSQAGPAKNADLDAMITTAESIKTWFALHEIHDRRVTEWAETLIGPVIAGASLARAARSEGAERDEFLRKAAKEVRQSSFSGLELANQLGQTTKYSPATTTVFALGADAWWRLAFLAESTRRGRGLRAEADAIRNNALSTINYQILVDQYELDKVDTQLRKIKRREPGGIKFNGDRADHLAAALDLSAVHYDPVRGQLILSGTRSEHVVDMEVFTACLRLALEQYEPTFGLHPVNPEQWDGTAERIGALVREKYLADDERRAGCSRLVRQLERQQGANPPQTFRGATYLYATVEEFDPELYDRALADVDVRVQLVYSPEWLRYSQVGQILYEADLAIKAIATGFADVGDHVALAPVWDIPGFDPKWIHEHESVAGRANFELDDSDVRLNGGSIDLAEVKPRLVVVHRRPGTSEDIEGSGESCPRCHGLSEHFSQHWREYVGRIPALGRLMTVFRAYVAARFLVRRFPGLAMRIHAFEVPAVVDPTPLYHLSHEVIRVRLEGGRLVPVTEDSRRLYALGGGYGGGVHVKMNKVNLRETAEPIDAWGAAAFAAGDPAAGYAEEGERTGLRLDFAVDRFDEARQADLWAMLCAGAAALGLALSVARRRAGPRGAAVTAAVVCPHCVRVHRATEAVGWCCDVAGVGTLAFLLALPVAVAWHEAGPTPGQAAGAFGVICAGLAGLAALAWLAQTALARRAGGQAPAPGLMRRIGAGARWGGAAMAGLLFARGWDPQALAGQVLALFGPHAGERMLALLGGVGTLRAAALAVIAAAAAALVVRWVVPFVAGSRPTLIAQPHA